MKKFVLTLVALLSLCSNLAAEVWIDPLHQVKNRHPGYCCWCCLEMLGQRQNVPALKGLTDARAKDCDYVETQIIPTDFGLQTIRRVIPKNFGSEGAVRQKLDSLGVKYKITHWDREHLKQSVKGNGCVVFVRANEVMGGDHAVILTNLSDDKFEYFDPNNCGYWRGDLSWFYYYWSGVAVSIE